MSDRRFGALIDDRGRDFDFERRPLFCSRDDERELRELLLFFWLFRLERNESDWEPWDMFLRLQFP